MSTGEKSRNDLRHWHKPQAESHPLPRDPVSTPVIDRAAEDSLLEPTRPLTLPEPWKMEHPPRTAIPNTSGKSGWQQCYQRVKEYDEDMCKVWKDEIDKLLIFAGLFSAAVTAFVVESYQWLDTTGDPTSQLLAQLISIQLNTTLPVLAPASVTVSPSAVRINICWFLSLILSLSAVLVGVLCLQWLREYERPVATSFEDKLRYRQVRYNGIIAWKVPRIITFLPVLLQIALILFFVGVVDLLWVRNHAVAIAVLVPIACVIFFLLATSLLPVFQVLSIRQSISRISKMTQCPYKSPLSWLIYCLVAPLLNITWSGEDATWKKAGNSPFRALWPRFDHLWVTSTDSRVRVLSQAVQWMKNEFKDDSTMITPVYECLKFMDGDVVHTLEEPLLQELSEICDGGFPCPTSSSDSQRIREVACILQLRGSLEDIHQVVLMEHLVRTISQDLDFLSFVPINWASSVRTLPREQCDAFIEQILICALCAIENSKLKHSHFRSLATILRDVGYVVFDLPPHVGSAIPYLLEMNLFKWKQWIEYEPAVFHSELPFSDRHSRARVVVEEFLDYFLPELFPTEVQPYLADLAWTAMKASPTGSASVFSDWSSDAWLAFFRLNSWDSVNTRSEGGLYRWWINRGATAPSSVALGAQRASAHLPFKKSSMNKSTPIFVSPGLPRYKLLPSPVESKQSPWSRVQNKLGLRAEVQMREVMNRPRLSPIASSSVLPRHPHMPSTLARSLSPEPDPELSRAFELPHPAVSTSDSTRPELQISIPVVSNTAVNNLAGA